METFYASLVLCAGNTPVTGEFPSQRPVTRSFGVFIDLCLIKRLSKQLWGWWFETPSRLSWRHCNALWYIYPYSLRPNPSPQSDMDQTDCYQTMRKHIQFFRFTPCYCLVSCHDANSAPVGTGGYDNVRCHQWQQSWHHEFSIMVMWGYSLTHSPRYWRWVTDGLALMCTYINCGHVPEVDQRHGTPRNRRHFRYQIPGSLRSI